MGPQITDICEMILYRGKKSLFLEPGTSKISIRTSIYFHPMSNGQVKKYSTRLYFHECPQFFFCNRTSKNLGILVRRTSEHFKIFYPYFIFEKNLTLFLKFTCSNTEQATCATTSLIAWLFPRMKIV